MSKQTIGGPKLTPCDDGTWILAEEWEGIPAGFATDGGSIPRFFWRFLGAPVEARTIGAYIKHDWKYKTGATKRKQADAELYDDLRESGVDGARSGLVWAGVRAFGWLYYNRAVTGAAQNGNGQAERSSAIKSGGGEA